MAKLLEDILVWHYLGGPHENTPANLNDQTKPRKNKLNYLDQKQIMKNNYSSFDQISDFFSQV